MIQEAPRTLDPRIVESVYESLPVNQIFDTLVGLDPSLNLVPVLAETWKISRDGLVYDFTLRDGVRFHDGAPVTADDVVFSVHRILRPVDGIPSLAYSYLLAIDGAREFADGGDAGGLGVEARSDRQVHFRLRRPYPSFLEVLTMDNLAVVPRHAVERLGDAAFGREAIGSGPFRLAEWNDDLIRLEANRDYFGGEPKLERLLIHMLGPGDDDFGAARFLRHELDMLEPATESLERLAREDDVRLHRYHELSLAFLGLNTALPPLDQLWLRQALAHALDRERLVRDSPSLRHEATGILPPGMSTYSPEPKALPHDPQRARELLSLAGHAGGAGIPPIRLFTPSTGGAVQQVIARIKSDLAAVGLRLEVVHVDWGELSQRLENGTAEAFLLAWVADLTDPDAFVRTLFESGGSGNFFNYCDEETDELLERGVAELNTIERSRLYRRLERHILDQAPFVPLYHTVGVLATRNNVEGLEPGPLGLAKLDFGKVWLHATEGASSVESVD